MILSSYYHYYLRKYSDDRNRSNRNNDGCICLLQNQEQPQPQQQYQGLQRPLKSRARGIIRILNSTNNDDLRVIVVGHHRRRHCLQRILLIGLFLFFLCLASQETYALAADDDDESNQKQQQQQHQQSSLWTVSWYAPFLSSASGYGSEATSFLVGLNRTLSLSSSPSSSQITWTIGAGLAHGDSVDQEYIANLPPDLVQLFQDAHTANNNNILLRERTTTNQKKKSNNNNNNNNNNNSQKTTIVICHSEPGAWSVPNPHYDSGMPCPPPSLRVVDNNNNNNNNNTTIEWNAIVIGRTMFETDRLPSGWEHRLNKMDEVWVPTHHHKRIFENGGVTKPVVVVGQGIDVEFWDPTITEPIDDWTTYLNGQCHSDDFKFLSVFKWEARKGPDVLLPSFFRAFPNHQGVGDNGVCLIIVTSMYHQEEHTVLEEVYDYWRSSKRETTTKQSNDEDGIANNHPPVLPRGIVLLSGLSLEALVQLYKSVDAFVLPSRGEGWGRPYMEAMAMGLPVIATNWSGPTEFVNEDNGYLLPIRGLVDANLDAFPNHKWADPDPKELERLFQHVKANPIEAKQKGEQARMYVVETWSNVAVSERVGEHLERLANEDDKIELLARSTLSSLDSDSEL